MQLGNDPSGGINKIYASSVAHNKDEDNRDLRRLFEKFTQPAKGPDGFPNPEERILTKWNAQLASEEVIRNWNEISDGALDKFMKDNFDKTWKKYDMYERGSIPEIDSVAYIRDLLGSLAPPEVPEINPYEEKKEEKKIEVDPIVEPDIEEEKSQNNT